MADSGTWTVRKLLEWTPGFFSKKGVDQPRLAAELLLSHVLNVPRIQLYTGYYNGGNIQRRRIAITRK